MALTSGLVVDFFCLLLFSDYAANFSFTYGHDEFVYCGILWEGEDIGCFDLLVVRVVKLLDYLDRCDITADLAGYIGVFQWEGDFFVTDIYDHCTAFGCVFGDVGL